MAQAPNPVLDSLEKVRRSLTIFSVAAEAMAEMDRQDELWGIQHHRDGTGRGYGKDVLKDFERFSPNTDTVADAARKRANHYAGINGGDALEWEQILTEEVFEAIEEGDPVKLRTELIQVAAVALSWVTDIDSREPADIDTDES